MEKSLSSKELAILYFKNCLPESGVKQLKRWIRKNKALKEALVKAGYHDKQRIFSPLQVALIFQYLGEP